MSKITAPSSGEDFIDLTQERSDDEAGQGRLMENGEPRELENGAVREME